MQTISFLLFRLQESGLGSQDILSEKPWELTKNQTSHNWCAFGNYSCCSQVMKSFAKVSALNIIGGIKDCKYSK